MYPKPTKKDRLKEDGERKQALRDFRHTQSALAIQRDNKLCTICWFQHGKRTEAVDIHHVYGRSNKSGKDIWKEDVGCLLSVCRECHPQPIITPGATHDLAYVEWVLNQANTRPINREFIPPLKKY